MAWIFAALVIGEVWSWIALTGMPMKRQWSTAVAILFTAFLAAVWLMVRNESDAMLWAGLFAVGGGIVALLLNSVGLWIIGFGASFLPDIRDPAVVAFEKETSDIRARRQLADELKKQEDYWATHGLSFLLQSLEELKLQISPALRNNISIEFEPGNQIAQIFIKNPPSTRRLEVRTTDWGFEIKDGGNTTKFMSADRVKEAIGSFVAKNLGT